jgi:plasmid stabilization system protein ParE
MAYMEGESSGRGMRFFEAVETRFDRLLLFPRMGHRVGRYARRLVMSNWRYAIIYTIERDHLLIVAIAHQSRRPGYWRSRLRKR